MKLFIENILEKREYQYSTFLVATIIIIYFKYNCHTSKNLQINKAINKYWIYFVGIVLFCLRENNSFYFITA